jgi:hypothetical protein
MDLLDDPHERVFPGEYFPAGQCPECGALIECTDEDVIEAQGFLPCDPRQKDAEIARLRAALEIALPTVELFTGNGAQTQPPGWPRDRNGDVDMEAVAAQCRAALAGVPAPLAELAQALRSFDTQADRDDFDMRR